MCWCNLLKGRKTLYSCCWMSPGRPQPQRKLGTGGWRISACVLFFFSPSFSDFGFYFSPIFFLTVFSPPVSSLCKKKGSLIQCALSHWDMHDWQMHGYLCTFPLNRLHGKRVSAQDLRSGFRLILDSARHIKTWDIKKKKLKKRKKDARAQIKNHRLKHKCAAT